MQAYSGVASRPPLTVGRCLLLSSLLSALPRFVRRQAAVDTPQGHQARESEAARQSYALRAYSRALLAGSISRHLQVHRLRLAATASC